MLTEPYYSAKLINYAMELFLFTQSLEELIDLPIVKKDTRWANPDSGVDNMFKRGPGVTNFSSNRTQSRKRVPDRPSLGEMD